MHAPSIGFVCAATILAAAIAPVGAKTEALPTAASVLAKMVAADGGEATLDSIKTQVIAARATIAGQDVAITTTWSVPGGWRQDLDFSAYHVKVIEAYDGTTAWASDAYGHVKILTGDQEQQVRCGAIEADPRGLRSSGRQTAMEVSPRKVIDGKSYIVLTVTPKGCPGTVDYVDPKTYLIKKVETSTQTLTFSNYKKGPKGELYPSLVLTFGAQGVVVVTITSIKDNVALDPSVFSVPPSPSPSPAASTTPASTTSPSSLPSAQATVASPSAAAASPSPSP